MSRKRNELLIAARSQRNWTQDTAADKIGVSRVAYARWEEQGIIPRPWAIDEACKVFRMTPEQLGFREYVSSTNTPTNIIQIPKMPTHLLPRENGSGNMVSVGVSALVLACQTQGYTIEELLTLVGQEMRRIEMNQSSTEQKISRKEMLRLMIGLPAALMGYTHSDSINSLSSEEILPLYVSSVPACWKLYYDGEFTEVESVLSSYIAHLTPLAQEISKHQRIAASLLSQAHQLASLLVLEHEDFGASLNHCKQALAYGNLINDPNIQLGAYIRRANTLYYRKRFSQQLQNYEEALQTVNIKEASPLIQGRVYSGYAGILCKFDGNKQQALRYDGLAHDLFPDKPEDDPSFIFTHATQYVINLNSMVTHLDLGNVKEASDAIERASTFVPNTINPRRVEMLNHQALVARAMNDLEECCTRIEEATQLGKQLGSDLYASDARDIINNMPDHWKHEHRVKNVVELLNT